MGKLPHASDGADMAEGHRDESSSLTLVAAMADTTWRMFVPTIGFTLLGVWLDQQWQTKPWCMALGIVIGACFAYILVKRQLNQSKRIGTN